MVFKVYKYVNLCEFRVGSCMTLGTIAVQSYIYMSLGCSIFMCQLYKPYPKDAVCQISEYLVCQFMRRKCSKIHPFCPLLGPNRCQPLDFCKLETPFPKDASYQRSKSVQWFWWSCLKDKLMMDRQMTSTTVPSHDVLPSLEILHEIA